MNIYDAHNDLLSVVKTKKDVVNYFKNNLNAEKIFCAYFSFNNDKNTTLKTVEKKFGLLKGEKRAEKTIENAWFLNYKNLRQFIKLKPFCVGLVHNKNNNLCGGAFEDGDFSDFGKFVVKKLEKEKIIIDTAHMNKKSFWQFLDLTQNPIFCSHTGFDFLFSHKRNLDNNQFCEVEKSGGFVGMALYPKFFCDKTLTIKEIAHNIFWLWNKFGTNTLGLGTDFNGINFYPRGIKTYCDLQKLEICLLSYGAKKEDVEKLFFKNLKRFYEKNKRS